MRTYGIEIEIISRVNNEEIANRIKDEFQAANLPFTVFNSASYHHNTDATNTTRWELKTDASLHPDSRGGHGVEIVSPVLSGDLGFKAVQAVSRVIDNPSIAYVNRTCGLHVHHGIESYESALKVAANFQNIEGVILNALPPSRRTNYTYCAPIANKLLDTISINRYQTLNLNSYSLRKTVEFRCAAGTTEATKIINWALVTKGIIEASLKGETANGANIDTVADFILSAHHNTISTSDFTFKKDWYKEAFEMIATGRYTQKEIANYFINVKGLNKNTVNTMLADSKNSKYAPLKILAAKNSEGKLHFPSFAMIGTTNDYSEAVEWLKSRYFHFQPQMANAA